MSQRLLQIRFRDPTVHKFMAIPVPDDFEIIFSGDWLVVPSGFVYAHEVLSAQIVGETKGETNVARIA